MEKITILEPTSFYHIYNKGNNNENLFIEEENYLYFLKLYSKYINPIADTFAYCLMKNHFHFLIEIKEGKELPGKILSKRILNLSQPFSNLFNAYTKSINKRYKRNGSLFKERYKRIKIEDENYLKELETYIHLNPVKHGFTRDFEHYPFSSYNSILSDRITHLKRDEVVEWFGDKDNFIYCHQEKLKRLDSDLDLTGL
ncbi:MAG: transposase [Chlorobi bacterium]|nr:transposase [Chlorobiota bacterium]